MTPIMGLYDVFLRLEAGGVSNANIESDRAFQEQLDGCLAGISRQLPASHPLVAELAVLRDRQQQRFEELTEKTCRRGNEG